MRCFVCAAVLVAVAAAAPAPQSDSYGAPPLTPAEKAATPLGGPGALPGRRTPLGAAGLPGRYAGGFGLPAGRFDRPLGTRDGPLRGPLGPRDGPLRGPLGPRDGPLRGPLGALDGPGIRQPLAGNRFINQGNPPNLRPDGFVDGPSRPYSFAYAVDEPEYGNNYGHAEESDGIVTQGEYRVDLPDGRTQIVTYSVEGDSGFQAVVRYEGEPQYPPPGATRGAAAPFTARRPLDGPLGGPGPLGPLGPRPFGAGSRPYGEGPGPFGAGPGPFGAGPGLFGAGSRPFGAGRRPARPSTVTNDAVVVDNAAAKPSTSYGI